MSYAQKAENITNAGAKRLLLLMEEKQTNLCVAADFTKAAELLSFADNVGPKICLFKTHIDIVEDFSEQMIRELKMLAQKHNFMFFEDRKFADIGKTVQLQYTKGMFRIASWADFVNAHTLMGPGIIKALHESAMKMSEPRGLILLAQVTPEGNLITDAYTEQTVAMAEANPEFVVGFIANGGDPNELKKLSARAGEHFILFAPGVKLGGGGDALGQRHTTPEDVIAAGADIIIVGRGVHDSPTPAETAEEYRAAGWNAYGKR